MTKPIEQDARRFRQIVRGKIKQNLRQFISNGEMIGRKGRELVSIPMPEIELPHIRFGDPRGGVGQGEGDLGTSLGPGQRQGKGDQAGDQPGYHLLEVELTLEELAEILGEELALPRIQPKQKNNVEGQVDRYRGLRRVGPESLRHFKRTYHEALKRQMASGIYQWDKPTIIPIRDDVRYRSWKTIPRPESNAVILYMMDVSGSMTQRKKELVRLTAFWIDTWLRAHYKNLATRYIVHDAEAHQVDAETFYHLRENGGTRISSAYELACQIIQREYPAEHWNIYGFHFSDGENFGSEDDERCIGLLNQYLLPQVNLFCYGQVQSTYGPQFLATLRRITHDKLVTAPINDDEDIYSAIKAFLGQGA